MPKVPAYNRSLNLVKGEPDRKKIKPTTIDRAKYQSILDKPMNSGDNLYSNDKNSFVSDVLGTQGFNYYSGTINGKDAVYKKGNNYYMYNERPESDGATGYGLVNIGDLSEPKQTVVQDTVVAPKVMPVDPMKVEGFNGMLKTDVQQFKSGGKVKGYFNGTTGSGIQSMDVDDPTMDTNVTGYAAAMQKANAKNAAKQQEKAAKDANIRAGANTAGRALGTFGTGYYAANPGENSSEQTRSAALGTVSQAGPVGGAIGGLAAIGDKIGKPIKERSEKFDENGNLINKGKAENNAVIGGIFSGTKALATRQEMNKAGYNGNKLFGAKKEYSRYLEGEEKKRIQAERDVEAQNFSDLAQMRSKEALAAREAEDVGYQDNFMLPEQKDYAPLYPEQQPITGQQFKDNHKTRKWWGGYGKAEGGVVSGKGTAKSDSINAKVEAGSFIVPAENAPIAKELAAKVLRKVPSKKANLNQKGQTDVRLSDGEYLFSPSEKEELIANGIDLEALAPNAKDDLINHLKCGGDVKGYAKGGGVKGGDKDRKPIEVSDPNDPRLKAYGDSLTLNKWSEGNLKDVKAGKYTPESWVASINKGTIQDKKADAAYARLSDLNKESPSPIKREEFYNGDIGVNLYKRPTQPVVLKKKESVDYLSPKSMSISESEDILPQRNYGKIQEAPKTTTEIVTTPNYQIKYTKDSTGKIIGEKYYNFDGNEISPDMQQFKSGGEVKRQVPSYKDGTDKKGVPPSNKKAGEMVEAKKAQDLKDRQSLLQKEKILKANLEINPKDYFSQAALKDVSSKIAKYNSIYGEPVIQFGSEETIDYMGGDKKRSKPPTANQVAIATGQKQASSKKAEAKAKAAVDNSSLAFDPTDVTDDVSVRPTSSTERQSTINANEAIDPTLQTKTPEQVTHLSGAYTAPTPDKKKFDYEGMLGSALNYGIPALQTGLGLRALKKAGDRPVDSLSPEYLATIAKTSGDVEAARQQAKYGFTGEQLAQAKMENNALTNSGRAFARNVAGGSGAAGLNAERAVLNDSFSRALSTRVQDKNLQLAKQQDAFNRQQGLNTMIADKQDRLRQYFSDKIGGWNQNQQSGAALVGAGLQNLVGASRYEQEKNAAKGREALANSWSTGLTK